MFTFKKLITPFLLPPGIFIIFLFLGGLWLYRRKNRGAAIFAWSMALIIWLAAAAPVANRLATALEAGLVMPGVLKGDVIILLGGGIYQDVRDLTGKGTPNNEMMARIVTAVRAQRKMHIPVIVSGGSVYPGRTPEARVVERFLRDLGIAKEMVIVEDKSRDTVENAEFTTRLCAIHGYRQPLLVTSSLHMPRAMAAYAVKSLKVQPLPVNLESADRHDYIWADCLPDASALEKTSSALHEYLGLLYYRLIL